jgi:hypothetical protein
MFARKVLELRNTIFMLSAMIDEGEHSPYWLGPPPAAKQSNKPFYQVSTVHSGALVVYWCALLCTVVYCCVL